MAGAFEGTNKAAEITCGGREEVETHGRETVAPLYMWGYAGLHW